MGNGTPPNTRLPVHLPVFALFFNLLYTIFMIKILKNLIKKGLPQNKSNSNKREEIIRNAVQRTVKEYGEALKRLGSE